MVNTGASEKIIKVHECCLSNDPVSKTCQQHCLDKSTHCSPRMLTFDLILLNRSYVITSLLNFKCKIHALVINCRAASKKQIFKKGIFCQNFSSNCNYICLNTTLKKLSCPIQAFKDISFFMISDALRKTRQKHSLESWIGRFT